MNLSKNIGFDEENLVSLYDLPAMSATFDENFHSFENIKQKFLFSRCHNELSIIEEKVHACHFAWKDIVDPITGKGAIHKLRRQARGRFAKCLCYYTSLCSKLVNDVCVWPLK